MRVARFGGSIGALAVLVLAPLAAVADEDPPWVWRGSLDWLTSLQALQPADSRVNPDNAVFEISQLGIASELRPNLRFELGNLHLILRPHFAIEAARAYADGKWQRESLTGVGEWTEIFGVWNVNDVLAVAYGLQNFQWGPAELFSPSNRIVHENGMLRNPLTLIPGKNMFRVNVSAGRSVSAILMVEIADNGEEPFVAGDTFEKKAVLKLEYARANSPDYVGFVAGKGERLDPWIGEYLTFELIDGLSIYADASHRLGSPALYPVEVAPGTYSFENTKATSERVHTFIVAGLRYSFERGDDVRVEVLRNDSGYTKNQTRRAADAVATSMLVNPLVIPAYLSPGLDFPGRDYAYVSVRVPDLGASNAWSAYARYLLSLTDDSGTALVMTEWIASDNLLLFLLAMYSHGDEDLEQTRLVRGAVFGGTRASW